MKQIQKYIYWAIATLVLGAIVAVGYLKSGDLPRFYITCEDHTEVVSTYNAGDGNYYVFLPAYADLQDITVDVPYFQPVTLNGIPLANGMDCAEFLLETPYELHYKRTTATLWFYKSANVATMFVNTKSGNMETIHKIKDHEESALISLYTAEGKIDCSDELGILKGRGNSSWECAKRPYALALSSEKDLLDMGAATNWVLLANAYDETNLNNKLILNLASSVSFQWVPESRWVDVYLNGEYNGLYLLTEKVEVHGNRLDIGGKAESFMGKIDLPSRWNTLRNPILTEAGRTIEIGYPRILVDQELSRVKNLVGQMETALLSGTNLANSTIIDLDSWVRRYLIDEISGNIDADHASSYFYFSDGVFYAGPIWDYDLALGNDIRNQAPCSFIAKNALKSSVDPSPYYSTLYNNDSFYARMVELYKTEFLPALQKLLTSDIDALSAFICKASQLNSLRWRSMYDMLQSGHPNAVHNVVELKQYLSQRIHFLSSAWLEKVDYCTVQYESLPGAAYQSISLKRGTLLNSDLIDLTNTLWICKDTGKAFDPAEPVTEDKILTMSQVPAAPLPPASEEDEGISPTYIVCLISVVVLAGLFLGIAGIDILQRRKERRHSGNGKRAKISP